MLRKTCVPKTVGAGEQVPLVGPLTHDPTDPHAPPLTDLSRVQETAFCEPHDSVNAVPAAVLAVDWEIAAVGWGAVT